MSEDGNAYLDVDEMDNKKIKISDRFSSTQSHMLKEVHTKTLTMQLLVAERVEHRRKNKSYKVFE